MGYRPPLHVNVVWHPRFTDGASWAANLERTLEASADSYAVTAVEIPTFVWTGSSEGEVPPPLDLAQAERTTSFLLVDTHWMASTEWRTWAERTAAAAAAAGPGHLLIVVAVSAHAINLGGSFATQNAIRLDRIPDQRCGSEFLLRAIHALVRHLLPGRTTRAFLSHTKAGAGSGNTGGLGLARALKQFIDNRPLGTSFFDEVSIEAGEDFVVRLESGLRDAVVVILLTDGFASRYWCRWEVVTTKRLRRPALLVDALDTGEPRNLAYAGNVRSIRWNCVDADNPGMQEIIVTGALLELLRAEHNGLRAAQLRTFLSDEDVDVMGLGPELATFPSVGSGVRVVLHPDPPLPAFELDLARELRPDLTFVSFTQALAGTTGCETPLAGRRVALSISDGPDRAGFGITTEHQARLWNRLALLLLASGAELAYGGDLRRGGYMVRLWDLVRGARRAGADLPRGVVHAYLGWPVHLTLTQEDRAGVPSAIELHEIDMPRGLLVDPTRYVDPASGDPEERFAWTASMSAMRVRMANECDARVLLGGQFRGVGAIPGLAEELLTFLDAGKPVYLIGGLGGMARILGRALLGESPVELTRAYQAEGDRATLVDHHDATVARGTVSHVPPADFNAMVERLARVGFVGLGNGLATDENRRLLLSADPIEIASLTLAGLVRTFGGRDIASSGASK